MRLRFVVEGETEEALVRTLLAPHFGQQGISCDPYHDVLVVGGNRWLRFVKLIRTSLSGLTKNEWALVTTLYDFYKIDRKNLAIEDALARASQPIEKATLAEEAMGRQVASDRFLPHVSLHEIEALLFSDLAAAALVRPDWQEPLVALAQEVRGIPPEHINEHTETSPSHRLARAIRGYGKVTDLPQILQEIGLPKLRASCPHFGTWVSAIEACGKPR